MTSDVPLCPHCASATETPLVCVRCSWRWYANPRPAAGTLVERGQAKGGARQRDASVLLLRRAVDPGYGAWDLPAGYLEPHESPEEAAVRETREEAGLEVELVRLVGAYASRDGNALSCVYLARPMTDDPHVVIDAESSDFAWVERREVAAWLPRMAFASMAAALEDWAHGRSGTPRPPGPE